jgi:hypothetical protein
VKLTRAVRHGPGAVPSLAVPSCGTPSWGGAQAGHPGRYGDERLVEHVPYVPSDLSQVPWEYSLVSCLALLPCCVLITCFSFFLIVRSVVLLLLVCRSSTPARTFQLTFMRQELDKNSTRTINNYYRDSRGLLYNNLGTT